MHKSDTIPMVIRVRPALVAKLAEKAKRDRRRSANEVAVVILEEALDQPERKPKP